MKKLLSATAVALVIIFAACSEPKPATTTPGDSTNMQQQPVDTAMQGDSMKKDSM